MPIFSFQELMAAAEAGRYAVGYFEAWNLESLFAVADAAAAMRSPVLLGYSGIHIPITEGGAGERLAPYAALAEDVARQLPVPACLLFNESPRLDWVLQAVRLRFGLVMFSDPGLEAEAQVENVRRVVREAHPVSVAVEGEMNSLPGVMQGLSRVPDDLHLTDPRDARQFVETTGVDALAVNIGQAHMHGRKPVRLDLARLSALRKEVPVPMVLHGGTSVSQDDLSQAIDLGIRKVNLGSVIKRSYFEGMRSVLARIGADFNPYEVVGSGLPNDVLTAGRLAMKRTVEQFMTLFKSAGKA